MKLLNLAWQSARARALTTALTVLSIALSTGLFLGVEKIRQSTRATFEQTVSGTDLIIGARSSPVNLLLYSVFRLGDPVANVSWVSYEQFSQRPEVAWTVPLSLGDSHGPFRVLGTTDAYFEHYRYAGDQVLDLREGERFSGALDAVLGYEAAMTLGYKIGDSFRVSHGLGGTAFSEHNDQFIVVGILAATGTPVDETIHVTLEGLDLVHGFGDHDHDHGHGQEARPGHASEEQGDHDEHVGDHHDGDHADGDHEGHDHHDSDHHDGDHEDHDHHDGDHHDGDHEGHEHHDGDHHDGDHEGHEHHDGDHHDGDHEDHEHSAEGHHEPQAITAFLVGLKSPAFVLRLQREVNDYTDEPLSAAIPAVALSQIWRIVGSVENALRAIAGLVLIAGLLGMLTMLLASLNERRREMAVFRAVGARTRDVFFLLVFESTLLAVLGALLGSLSVQFGVTVFADQIQSAVQVPVGNFEVTSIDFVVPLVVALCGFLVGFIPAWQAYRQSLSDGLSVRL